MPGIELHADFDRDGRLSGSAAERKARSSWPGAIVVANLDTDARSLPKRPGTGRAPLADFELSTAVRSDDELVPLSVRVAPGALDPSEDLRLRCSPAIQDRIRISDSTGNALQRSRADPSIFELPTPLKSGRLELTLQVRTIAGSSFGRRTTLDLVYTDDGIDETRFELFLERADLLGKGVVEDTGRFTIAPVILDDCLAPATRFYIVKHPANHPTLVDIAPALRKAGVAVVEVPLELTSNDAWLQDQFQHGLMQGPSKWREIILHMPRLRKENSNATVSENLEGFVSAHFRSRDIALFNDLWDRQLSVADVDGKNIVLPFRDLVAWVRSAGRVYDVADRIETVGGLVDPKWTSGDAVDWVAVLESLTPRLTLLQKALDRKFDPAKEEEAALLARTKAAISNWVAEVLADHGVTGKGARAIVRTRLGTEIIRFQRAVASKFFARASQMNDAANYGGNIEASPPLEGAAFGKIVIGNFRFPAEDNVPDSAREFVDPDLLRVLAKQQKQPIVEINTAWLRVGHVDEVLAMLPHRSAGLSVLQASSATAMAILHEARKRHRSGRGAKADAPPAPPHDLRRTLMTDGTSPVTRMLRGKSWRHRHEPAQPGIAADIQEPPSIYLRLAHLLAAGVVVDDHKIGYVPGEGPMRRYPADITIDEFLFCEQDKSGVSSNEAIESVLLAPIRATIAAELGVAPLSVPVLWDRVRDAKSLAQTFPMDRTTAFSPDLANLQNVNGQLLVPKPYGPRMNFSDAIFVVRQAMRRLKFPAAIIDRVGPRLIAKRKMRRETYWVEKSSKEPLYSETGSIKTSFGGMMDKEDVIRAFRDSFPGATKAELERKIIEPNKRHFDTDGNLRADFTPILIDDGMVDLFELFAAATIHEEAGTAHFVDTWFYHLGEGQIHCGTNILRKRRAKRPATWDAPDFLFRARTINFDPAETTKED